MLKKVQTSLCFLLSCYMQNFKTQCSNNLNAGIRYMESLALLYICEVHLQVQMSRDPIFPTMWYVRPAKPQINLRIRAV